MMRYKIWFGICLSYLPYLVTAQPTAQSYYEAALQAYQQRDLSKTDSLLGLAVQRDARFALAYARRGLLRYELSDYQGALADYRRAFASTTATPAEWQYQVGVIHYRLQKPDSAQYYFEAALATQPRLAEAHTALGTLAEEHEDYPLALRHYTAAIAAQADFVMAYYNRGILYYELGKRKLAFADWAKAVELKPDYWEVYLVRGEAYLQSNDYQTAHADFNAVLRLRPYAHEALKGRGLVHWKQKRAREACADWQRAADLGSIDAEKLLNQHCKDK